MAAPVIQVDYDRLAEVARGFERNAETAAAMRKQVQRNALALRQGGWDGRGSIAFFAEVDGVVLPAVQRLADALQEAGSVSRSIVEIMQQAEEEAARPFHTGGESPVTDVEGKADSGQGPRIDPGEWLDWIEDRISAIRQEVGNMIDKSSELLDRAELVVKKLSEVQWSDVVDTEGLQGDWLGLYSVWFFETSPEDLGTWSELDGAPMVTITDSSYINDLRNKPNYTEAIESLRTTYPDPKVGDSISYPFRIHRARHNYRRL